MARRRRCPICGSRKWHKEPQSGMIVCSEGHVLPNYRNETHEMDTMGPHAMHKRTIKSTRVKGEGKKNRANLKLYHGDRARFFYFQCLQILLRKQVAALKELWALPQEFEIIVRDTWALHLSLFPSPPPAEPYFFEKEAGLGAKEAGEDEGKGKEKEKAAGDRDEDGDGEKEEDDDGRESISSSSSDDGEEDGDEDEEDDDDRELASLMRANSACGSSSDTDRDGEASAPQGATPLKQGHKKRRKGRTSKEEGPMGNVAVLVLACWTMRLPVMYKDLVELIDMYKLPYLDPLRYLPASMLPYLNKHVVQGLTLKFAPRVGELHELAARLCRRLHSEYGIITPSLNAAPMLWRIVRELGGTPVLYMLAKRLAHVLSLPLALHPTSGAAERRRGRAAEHEPVEVALVAVVVVVTKLVYGLDGHERVASDEEDPACALPAVGEWLKIVQSLEESAGGREEAIFGARSGMCVGELTEDQLDRYMDLCTRALLSPRSVESDAFPAKYFPLLQHGDHALQHQTTGVPTPVSAGGTGGGDGALLPGAQHTIFSARDVTGSLPAEFAAVVRRAAGVAGVEDTDVLRAVEVYERRVARWWAGEKRRGSRI